MSEERNFDDHIRNEFANYSPEVAPHIWENIVAERKKRRPVGFWFILSGTGLIWLTALILAGAVGTGLIISHFTNKTNTTNTIASNNVVGNNNTSIVTNDNTANNNNKQVLSSTKDENKKSNSTLSIQQNSSDTQVTNVNKINDVAIVQTSSTEKVKAIISHTKKNTLFNYPGSKINNDNGDKAVNATTDMSYNNTVNEENTVASNIRAKANKNNSVRIAYTQQRFGDKINRLLLDQSMAQSSLIQKSKLLNLPECPLIEKDAAGNKKYIEVYIAPDYAVRTITDTANSAYLQKRKETTQLTSAFSAGIRYTKVFNNGVSLRGGLNYSQINEKFSFVEGNVVQVTYTIDPTTGDTTGSYTVRGTRYKTTYNHYRSIDIPLTIGYEFGNGRFHTNINAGIIANVYSWQKGEELDTNGQPVSINTGKEGSPLYQFRTNVGLGATGGVSFYYKLTDQIHFLAEPYIRYNFEPLTTNNLTLQQKYTTIGLRLGLRFDLPNAGSVIKR